MATATATSYGQVIEYIEARLYLAAYTHPPNDSTPFPYQSTTSASPRKKKSQHVSAGPKVHPPVYFSIDDSLLYNRFHADFGPLHIGHLYRFAVQLHDVLGDPQNEGRGVVFWSKADPRSRANAACILACYMVLIQSWPPHLALAPISQIDPPLMPFRDAGYSQADYGLTVQDVVYGVWKAKEEGLCGLKEFNLEEYERYERVDMGDFNWITPNFIAFASPQHKPVASISPTSPEYALLPQTTQDVERSMLPLPFKNVLCHFKERKIGLVVRLNSELYSPSHFVALGIEHVDMIFDDGTYPALGMVRKFIRLAHDTITKQKKNVAVHCKAGLGRTGCLIGAYLIYRYGFTANDLIAFMRFMRPGMVVGPQQHWLHLNQGTFRQWWWEDSYKEKLSLMMPATPTKTTRKGIASVAVTPPHASPGNKRAALGEINHNEGSGKGQAMEDCLPAPTPGQPRKTSRMNSPARQGRAKSASFGIVEDEEEAGKEIVEMHTHRRSQGQDAGESEEEWQLRRMSRRTSSRSPGTDKKRSVSYTTTTTTTTYNYGDEQMAEAIMSDVENWTHDPGLTEDKPKTKTSGSFKSGSGSGMIGVSKTRTPSRRNPESREIKNGVRKTSGRVGSTSGLRVR